MMSLILSIAHQPRSMVIQHRFRSLKIIQQATAQIHMERVNILQKKY